jgi:hypothetical protein
MEIIYYSPPISTDFFPASVPQFPYSLGSIGEEETWIKKKKTKKGRGVD